jgi:hypothetical protein
VRDAQIKPAWDRALADLEDARRRAEEGPREVEAYLDEGRTSGALPGWLREGSDLEPEPAGPEADGAEPREPEVLAEPPSDP